MSMSSSETHVERRPAVLHFCEYVEKVRIPEDFRIAMRRAKILKVEISSSQKRWRVHLLLDKLVKKYLLDSFSRQLIQEIDGLAGLDFCLKYHIPDLTLQDIIDSYWDDIVFSLASNQPMLLGWLKSAEIKQQHHKITVNLNNNGAEAFINTRNVSAQIDELINSEFGISSETSVLISEEQIATPADEHEKEYVKTLLAQTPTVPEERKKQMPDQQPSPTAGKAAGQWQPRKKKSSEPDAGAIKGRFIREQPITIQEITEEEKCVVVQGIITRLETRILKSGRTLVNFDITDLTDSITVKFFEDEKDEGRFSGELSEGRCVRVRGPVQPDEYSRDKELMMMVWDICPAEFQQRKDEAEVKRIELHLHTKMSSMDGVTGVKEAVKTAASWGHSAVAITDHGVVQAFPDAYEAGKKFGIKIIYGVEGYLIDDAVPIVINANNGLLEDGEFVVFDLETTGFSPNTNEIIEIGAVKIKKGEIIDRFSSFVRPLKGIPFEVQKLTGILPEMTADAERIESVLPKFMAFAGESILVAHNAQFDAGFLRANLGRLGAGRLENPVLDTLGLARGLLPNLKNHKLNTLAKEFGVPLDNHHRAVDDAEATSHIFLKCLKILQEKEILRLDEVNTLVKNINLDKLRAKHIILLVQNYTGLRNLYQLITKAHLKYYYRNPRIPRSELIKHREGLIIGSACEAGELIGAYLDGAGAEKLEEIASFYDYLEIQPIANNEFLVRQGKVENHDALRKMNKDILELGLKLNKPVVATGDVHFLEPSDGFYRQLLMAGKGFDDADNQAPLYFKTTVEMLEEFAYLGEDMARQVVINNPVRIAEQIEAIKPMPDDFYPPKIDGAEEQISGMTLNKAREIYGEVLPEVVQKRADKELNSIISNGFAVLYFIAHKLVKKSNEDGYLVGSRGSVGSSFVATMTGITEVNPLPPHYVCPNCKHSEFIEDGSYGCGAEMPDKDCPECGTKFKKDGFDIPFEVFLGFEGDKVPDIDLNFSGDYQPRAHKYTEELFGEGYVFRAGTIGTIAAKTAYGFVQKYLEEKGFRKRKAEIDRLVNGCTGVKRTTGQHPGGVMVIPRDMDVHDFTPLQYPADDKKSGIITTHFDYHSISGRIVKLDILGHDDPTVIKMLEDLTGVDAKTIPLDEPQTMSLFSSVEVLGVTPEQIKSNMGTYAIPEFGTKFVRQMLEDTKPTTFSELVRISGFSHGTDVWLNNAQDLIREGVCQLSEAISARDDIMVYLIYKGLEPGRAFKIMEGVRKGKGVKPDDEAYMLENKVPQWYIESCKKIKYMFPKAHAVAYVMMAYRIAYFKVYYPEAFYTTYYTVRADEFDAEIICQGSSIVAQKIDDIESRMKSDSKADVTTKEKNQLTILEVALEMYERGIKIRKVSLYESHASKFQITEEGILPPFAALQGLGGAAAQNIVNAREEKAFTSVEDLRIRAKVSKTVIEIMQQHGCLEGLPETDQMALF